MAEVLSFTAIGTLNVLAAAGGTPQDDEHERRFWGLGFRVLGF